VARSEPDGYTLLVLPSAHPAHGALARNVNYKVVEDFEWISVASFYPFLICVRKDSRFQTLTQLIDEARKNPGVLKYGSAGVGSILHTTVELIGNETKTKFLHIPYRGEAPAMTGLLQGDIDFIAATSGPISARIRSGEFRALAVTGKTRWRDFSDVPTVAEEAILVDRARGSREAANFDRRQAQCRGAPRRFSPRREGQAREHGRRSTRDHTRRDACAGGQPVRDLEETSERGEHLDRLDVVGVPRPGGNEEKAFCERTSAHASLGGGLAHPCWRQKGNGDNRAEDAGRTRSIRRHPGERP
jgi:hypothetical protein